MIKTKRIPPDEYEALYTRHMVRDFPAAGGLAPFHSIKNNLEKNIYEGIYLTLDSENIGYALITAPENLQYALINYFAVYPERRSKGYGSGFLRIIMSRYSGRVIILELENPAAIENKTGRETAERRVRFYERAGFRALPAKSVKIFGADMLIMAGDADNPDENLNAREVMHALYLPAFGDASRLMSRINIEV